MSLKISVSGMRGIVGEDLDAEVAVRLASAFGGWLPQGPVVLARDSRPSGPMLGHAVAAGLLSTGHDVVDAGILSTPGTEYLVQTTDAIGGVIVTASHNPVAWNALKLLRHDGLFLDAQAIAAVTANAGAQARGHRHALQLGSLRLEQHAERRHLDAILRLDLLDRDAIQHAGLRVVVDCVEGAGGAALPALLRDLGVQVVEIGCGLTGHFPHDPEPRPEHLQELAARVASEGADLGLAVDPDVDRLSLVDRGGVALSEECTLVLAADFVLRWRKGPMVVNLSTTMLMDRVARTHGVPLLRTPVGEANVVQKMLEIGAVVGGEGNGGVILPALHPGRDALLGAALVLAAVAEAGSLRACLERFPRVAMAKDKLALTAAVDDPALWERALRALGGSGRMDATDGLRYDRGDSWIHLRRSNTENALRLIAEAADEATARAMIGRVRSELEA
jgi:phosphomannomutase